jgi:hypothetical protein
MDTSSLLTQAKAMLNQTQAQGTAQFAGSSFDTQKTNPIAPANQTTNTTQPTIALGTGVTKPNLPMRVDSSALAPAKAAIGNVNALNGNNGQTLTGSQTALLNSSDANVNNAQDTYNQDKADTQGLINSYLGMGADQLSQEQAAGVPELRTQSNQLTQQYLAQQNNYNQQYNQVQNDPALTIEQRNQKLSALQQQHGYDLTDTGIRQSIAQNDYNNAEALIQHQIQIKYGALKDTITFQQEFLKTDASLLSQKEQNSFAANLQVQQQMYTQSTYYAQLNASTSMDLLKSAKDNSAPADVIQQMGDLIAKGASAGDVAAVGAQYTSSGSYTPVQTGYDVNTGLPIYSTFNNKTGKLEVKNPGNTLGETGNTGTTVTIDGQSYQMGASTTMGAYASATTTQVNNINNGISKISATVGNVTDTNSAQLAINAVSKNSPITGQMVMTAATQYGVSPAMLIATMQAETQCGTDGSKGAKECNWGNVGNTDSLMASGGSVKMTPQAGVDAVAKNLAMRQVQQGQNDPAQPETGTLTPTQIANQIISAAPKLVQPAMGYTSTTGGVYIDTSKLSMLPEGMRIQAQNYASAKGIPMLDASQVGLVKTTDEAIRNIVNVIAPAWEEIAPKNIGDKILNTATVGFSTVADTDFYAKNKTFLANRESLAQQIKALSGSSPKLGLLGTAESALPTNAGYSGFGGQYDTLKDGNMKMERTLQLLNESLKTFLPNATPVTLKQPLPTGTAWVVNGKTYTLGADGLYY